MSICHFVRPSFILRLLSFSACFLLLRTSLIVEYVGLTAKFSFLKLPLRANNISLTVNITHSVMFKDKLEFGDSSRREILNTDLSKHWSKTINNPDPQSGFYEFRLLRNVSDADIRVMDMMNWTTTMPGFRISWKFNVPPVSKKFGEDRSFNEEFRR